MRNKFQRRHYEAIAEVIHVSRESGQAQLFPDLSSTVDTLAHLFARDNPRFDRARFLAACEVRPTHPRRTRR